MADMPGKNEKVSLDMFLEVENMELDCQLAFSACYSATSCWEGRWNDVEGSEKADFQRFFSCNKVRSRLLRAQRCWHAVARVGHSWCSRVRAGLYLVKTAKVLWQNREQIQEITSGVQFERIKSFSVRKNVRVVGRKKRKTVRDSGVVNGAVTQGAVCKDGWVRKNECKLFGGPVFEKPVAGVALRSTSCTTVRDGES